MFIFYNVFLLLKVKSQQVSMIKQKKKIKHSQNEQFQTNLNPQNDLSTNMLYLNYIQENNHFSVQNQQNSLNFQEKVLHRQVQQHFLKSDQDIDKYFNFNLDSHKQLKKKQPSIFTDKKFSVKLQRQNNLKIEQKLNQFKEQSCQDDSNSVLIQSDDQQEQILESQPVCSSFNEPLIKRESNLLPVQSQMKLYDQDSIQKKNKDLMQELVDVETQKNLYLNDNLSIEKKKRKLFRVSQKRNLFDKKFQTKYSLLAENIQNKQANLIHQNIIKKTSTKFLFRNTFSPQAKSLKSTKKQSNNENQRQKQISKEQFKKNTLQTYLLNNCQQKNLLKKDSLRKSTRSLQKAQKIRNQMLLNKKNQKICFKQLELQKKQQDKHQKKSLQYTQQFELKKQFLQKKFDDTQAVYLTSLKSQNKQNNTKAQKKSQIKMKNCKTIQSYNSSADKIEEKFLNKNIKQIGLSSENRLRNIYLPEIKMQHQDHDQSKLQLLSEVSQQCILNEIGEKYQFSQLIKFQDQIQQKTKLIFSVRNSMRIIMNYHKMNTKNSQIVLYQEKVHQILKQQVNKLGQILSQKHSKIQRQIHVNSKFGGNTNLKNKNDQPQNKNKILLNYAPVISNSYCNQNQKTNNQNAVKQNRNKNLQQKRKNKQRKIDQLFSQIQSEIKNNLAYKQTQQPKNFLKSQQQNEKDAQRFFTLQVLDRKDRENIKKFQKN